MKKRKFSLALLTAIVVGLLCPAYGCTLGHRAMQPIKRAMSFFHFKRSKSDEITVTEREVKIVVKPKKNYKASIGHAQRLALELDARDGRIWKIESRPDEIADERPEGRAEAESTTIYFTPKEVDGEGDIVLKTKIMEHYPENWSNADTCVVHMIVNNAP